MISLIGGSFKDNHLPAFSGYLPIPIYAFAG
jgi:hypothetical protein